LSAPSWNSPALRLQIGDSRWQRRLLALLAVALAASLWLIHRRGYPGLCWSLLVPEALLWLALVGQRWRGAELCRQSQGWALQRDGVATAIELRSGSICLPWGIYIPFRECAGGRGDRLWLFADSVEPGALRRLRVRLALEGRVRRDQDRVQRDGQ